MTHLTARNPDGTPAPPSRSTVNARPGWVARTKLTEPARLYGHGLVLVAAVALLPVVLDDELGPGFIAWAVGVLLALALVIEAVRASVYSPATAVALVLSRQGQPTIPAPESESAR